MSRLLLASLLLCIGGAAFAASPEVPSVTDPVLRALADELARARGLKMEKLDAPYFLAAVGNDQEYFHVAASFGALEEEEGGRRASAIVEARVGSPLLDNTNFADRDGWSFDGDRGTPGIPLEPDYDALRRGLWLQFDSRYKQASETIARKRAFLQSNSVQDRPADFGPAELTSLVLPRQGLAVDRDRFRDLVKRASAVFRAVPEVYSGRVALRATMAHQAYVNSEGARHLFPDPAFELSIVATTQAADGMPLAARWETRVRFERELPTDAAVLQAAQQVAAQLKALARAPHATEDYSGPVLLTGRAAAAFFMATVGEPLSQPRDNLGESVQGRMVTRLGKHVASKLLTVRDDPTQREWHGQPLLGSYPVDDDSVLPQPITLIEKGVLKTYYMSRTPTRLVQKTNGHCRNGVGAVGNLFVEGSAPQPMEALTRRLVELAREEDYDYGLLVEDVERSSFRSRSYGGATTQLPTPSIVWRIFADGRREQVRGLTFKPASGRLLKDIEALGDDPTAVNLTQRGNRVSVVAPSVLLKLVELQVEREEHQKPPLTPRPPVAALR